MNLESDKRERLDGLLEALFEDRAGAAEFEELDRLLRDDPEMQREYLHKIDLHHAVRWQMAGEATYRSLAALKDVRPEPKVRPVPVWVKITAAAAALFMALLLAGTESAPPPSIQTANTAPPVAVLMDLKGAAWIEAPARMQKGAALPTGSLKLSRGTAEVEFTSGTRLLLQAPAHLELSATDRAYLHRGTVTVAVPAATEFRMGAPGIQIVNESSEFGFFREVRAGFWGSWERRHGVIWCCAAGEVSSRTTTAWRKCLTGDCAWPWFVCFVPG